MAVRRRQPPSVEETVETPIDHTDDTLTETEHDSGDEYTEEEEHPSWFEGSTAVKFLLAGGFAGGGESGLNIFG